MKRFTSAGRRALADNNVYAALSLALMIPDICASMEDPGPYKSQKRYARWCRTWVEPKFTSPVTGRVFLTADDCYHLRCSLIHSGSSEIDPPKRKDVDLVAFFDDTYKGHCQYAGGIIVDDVPQPAVLQLNATKFSVTMYELADEWDASVAGDKQIQKEKAKLLTIHSIGAVLGGVMFS